MKTYYEIEHKESGGVIGFEDLENAIEYAESNECGLICEVGGSWTEFKKCWFCGEWVDVTEMNDNDLCNHCENYLISRGEI